MAREGTFQNHLEKLLGAEGADANVNQRLITDVLSVRPDIEQTAQYALTCLKARKMDRESKMGYNEDFIIEGLPRTSRLNAPVDVVQAAKDFYSARGFKH